MIRIGELRNAIEGRVVALIHKTEARGCRVYRSSTQAISDSTFTALSFDTEVEDTDGCWAVGAPTQLVAQRDGYYLAGGAVSFATGGTGVYRLYIDVMVNGTTILAAQHDVTGSITNYYLAVASGMVWLSVGDYVEVRLYQTSGGALNSRAATATNQHTASGWLMRVG